MTPSRLCQMIEVLTINEYKYAHNKNTRPGTLAANAAVRRTGNK